MSTRTIRTTCVSCSLAFEVPSTGLVLALPASAGDPGVEPSLMSASGCHRRRFDAGHAGWPDAARRDACEHGESESLRLMTEATAYLEQLPADIVLDLLDEPRTTPGSRS